MAATVWLVRRTEFRGGRLGAVRVDDSTAADLIKKGDALPFDASLRGNLAALKAGERSAEADAPEPKRRGRPPKAQAEAPEPEPEPAQLGEFDLSPLAQADEPEPDAPRKKGK